MWCLINCFFFLYKKLWNILKYFHNLGVTKRSFNGGINFVDKKKFIDLLVGINS